MPAPYAGVSWGSALAQKDFSFEGEEATETTYACSQQHLLNELEADTHTNLIHK